MVNLKSLIKKTNKQKKNVRTLKLMVLIKEAITDKAWLDILKTVLNSQGLC